ncbi:MAG: hypothetical protein ACMZ7B_11235 [Balneola sp.]
MTIETYIDNVIPFLKKWGVSMLLFVPGWILVEQYWVSFNTNILFAVNYPYPFFLSPIFFILDASTLLIHEGGHTIFGFLGWRFLTILGGSLMSWLIPFLIFVSAWYKNQRFVAQFSLFWLSYAWFSSAAYCMDAYHQNLPLIGNLPKSAHDYTNMLSMLNILDKYQTVAWIMFVISFIILILCMIWPLFEKKDLETIDLSMELKKSGLR